MRVVATAGHVDHGKSTLVQALTGTHPDRLAEEKARGMTIDLGFAAGRLPSGESVAFVDVPGHSRFLKNMLAGAGAVAACLFVVAANEGWKPQSEEHLRILDILGVGGGVVAVTKTALVAAADVDAVVELVEARVAGTLLEGAPIVAVDSPSGRGVEAVAAALDRVLADAAPAADDGRPRLWIDRSFPIAGAGTVVTGTLAGGKLEAGGAVTIEPGGLPARIRGLQSHGTSVAVAEPGTRVAVNLTGVGHRQVGRGQAVVLPDQWHRSAVVDASLVVLESIGHPVTRRGAFLAYVGSGEFPARVRVLGGADRVTDAGFVRLMLAARLPLVPGDRYVLREAGRGETVGGGEILDVDPVLPARRARPSRSVERVVAERGWVDASELARLTGVTVPPTVGRWVVDPPALATTRAALLEAVGGAGPAGLDPASLDEHQRAVLSAGLPGVHVSGGRALAGGSAGLTAGATALLDALERGRWSPPAVAAADRAAARELQRHGLAVEAGGEWFAASAVADAAEVVAGLLAAAPGGVTVADVRDALGTSRKHVLPLLAHFDSAGVTRRRGDLRIAGPRLAG